MWHTLFFPRSSWYKCYRNLKTKLAGSKLSHFFMNYRVHCGAAFGRELVVRSHISDFKAICLLNLLSTPLLSSGPTWIFMTVPRLCLLFLQHFANADWFSWLSHSVQSFPPWLEFLLGLRLFFIVFFFSCLSLSNSESMSLPCNDHGLQFTLSMPSHTP